VAVVGGAGGGTSGEYQGGMEGAGAPRPPSEPSGESGGSVTPAPAGAARSEVSRGHSGRVNIPHSVGWTVGTWAGATRRSVANMFRSNERPTEEVEG